jgi:hypothetical protein
MVPSYNRYTNFSSVGNYKDIVDDLFYVNENDSPIMDMGGSKEARDYIHYWEEVVYSQVTSNAYKRADGGSLSSTMTPATKTERSNYVVETAVPFDVSKRAAAIAKRRGAAGVRNAWEKAKMDADVILKDNVEYSLLQGASTSGDGSNASECQGLMVMAAALGTDAYNTNISGGESAFRTGLTTNRDAGGMKGKKKMIFTSYTNKDSIMKNWTGRATAINDMKPEAGKIYADVEIYVSQFGPIAIMGHSMALSTELVVFDGMDLATAWLYPTQTIELGTTNLVEGTAARANCLTLEYERPSTLMYMTIS